MRYDLNVQSWTFPWFWRPRLSGQTDWKSGFDVAIRLGHALVILKVWRGV